MSRTTCNEMEGPSPAMGQNMHSHEMPLPPPLLCRLLCDRNMQGPSTSSLQRMGCEACLQLAGGLQGLLRKGCLLFVSCSQIVLQLLSSGLQCRILQHGSREGTAIVRCALLRAGGGRRRQAAGAAGTCALFTALRFCSSTLRSSVSFSWRSSEASLSSWALRTCSGGQQAAVAASIPVCGPHGTLIQFPAHLQLPGALQAGLVVGHHVAKGMPVQRILMLELRVNAVHNRG